MYRLIPFLAFLPPIVGLWYLGPWLQVNVGPNHPAWLFFILPTIVCSIGLLVAYGHLFSDMYTLDKEKYIKKQRDKYARRDK